jgi:cysteine desulfurase
MSERIYLDNAATTPLDKQVLATMMEVFQQVYGNPSATHALGRQAKGILENSRTTIAKYLNAKSAEIYFTSGGTEADNMALRCAVQDFGIKNIITSVIEHKAIIDTAKALKANYGTQLHLVDINEDGSINMSHLAKLTEEYPGSLVSIMHANNEIGTLNDLKAIADICHQNKCIFHSDTVQTMCHYKIDVLESGVDMLSCSAHKFNGPKGVGFLFMNSSLKAKPLFTGGGQERNTRPGTENVPGIAGMAKAFEVAHEELEEQQQAIQELKNHTISLLTAQIPGVAFNGNILPEKGLYTVLNVSLPPHPQKEMLLFKLDLEGVCLSGGSACNSGAAVGSHVLNALNHPQDRLAMRFSFGKYNTKAEIEKAVSILSGLFRTVAE